MCRLAAFLVFLVGTSTSALAHHAISAEYDTRRRVEFQATVVRFAFVNPHPYIVVETADAGGRAEWRIELDNRFELERIGMDENTFAPGDRVRVTANPSRNQRRRAYVLRLEHPDFSYEQAGSSPRLVSPR